MEHTSTITHALRIAAEKFDENACFLRDMVEPDRLALAGVGALSLPQRRLYLSLAEQFEEQARHSRTVAEQIEAGELAIQAVPEGAAS